MPTCIITGCSELGGYLATVCCVNEHVRDLYYCLDHWQEKAAILYAGSLYCTACMFMRVPVYSLLYTDEMVIEINREKLDKPVIRV